MTLLRIGALVGLLAVVAAAQIARTTIDDTVYDLAGNPASGSVTITSAGTFTSADGHIVADGSSITVALVAGQLDVSLVPNAGSAPIGSYYVATYHLTSGSFTEDWIVPSSSSPVDLGAVRVLQPPGLGLLFGISQIEPPANCVALGGFVQYTPAGWTCNASAGGGLANPMTTAGDMIVGATNGTPERLAAGGAGQVLESNGPGVAPSYQDPIVSGPAASGTAPGGNPVLIAGESSDGLVRTLNTDTSGHANINVLGTVPVSGNFWQATQPVSLLSLPALASGSNTIGAVDQAGPWTVGISGTPPMNIAQANGIALGSPTAWGQAPAGNVLGVNADVLALPAISIASGQTVGIGSALPAGTNNIGHVTVDGTVPVSLGSLPVLPAGSNNIGHVNVDNFPATQPVSGTVTANAGSGFPVVPTASAAVNDSASGLTQIVAGASGKSIYVTGYTVVANAAVTVQWEYGTGTNCGTGTTALTGPMSFAADGGAAPRQTLFVPSGDALCLDLGAAVQVGGSVSYAQQ